MLVEGVDDVFPEGKLVRVGDHGPVLKKLPRRGKNKNQDQCAKNVVLKRASRVTPKDDFIYSRHSFLAAATSPISCRYTYLNVDRILFAIETDIVLVRDNAPIA